MRPGHSRSRAPAAPPWALWLAAGLLLAGLPGGAPVRAAGPDDQVEEEDLSSETLYEGGRQETRRLFEEAEAVFQSADQPASVELLGEVIRKIDERSALGVFDEADQELLLAALFYRAEALFNLGELDAADTDLGELVETRPGFRPDPERVSPKLIERLEQVRKQTVGAVRFPREPPDTRLVLAGEPLEEDAEGAVWLVAGGYRVQATRPGFAPQELEIEVPAGKTTEVPITLERVSAVVQIVASPAGVEVSLDSEPVGETSSSAPAIRMPGAATYDPASGLALLVVEGLTEGEHLLQLDKAGYRSRRLRIDVKALSDYVLEPVELERTEGIVELGPLPAGAEITVDGLAYTAERTAPGRGRLRLAPGEHQLRVRQGATGWYETRFELADRQRLELVVRLRPGLAFLGALGGDQAAAATLATRLPQVVEEAEGWTFLDRSEQGPRLAAGGGASTALLRRVANLAINPRDELDWANLQRAADGASPGSAYLLAVLSDDLLAKAADLWLLPAAPAPAVPVRRRLELRDEAAWQRLAALFGEPLALERPTLGLEAIDSAAASHPIVAFVAADGPAAAAGVRVGDEILAAAGEPLATSAELERRLAAAAPGSGLALKLSSGAVTRSVEVRVGTSPLVAEPTDPEFLYPLAWAELTALADEEAPGRPAWILDLNRAAALLSAGAGAEAVKVLRAVRAPARTGVGAATVDYWLGVALLQADAALYAESARDALERARGLAGGRLGHDGGPTVALRAAGRLAELAAPR